MAVQTDPPIQIDPNMDKDHQWAFVNQNFRSISDVLNKQNFVVVSQGNLTLSSMSTVTTSASQYATGSITDTVTHNLGYPPTVFAFAVLTSVSPNVYIPLPKTIYGTSGTAASWYNATVSSDSVNVYFDQDIMAYNYTGGITPSYLSTVKYFLLRLSASS